ncbi:MAG: hypothetical protein KGJ92_02745 [Actinomycetales bacterium]|nr:hypothetical protein [Actinomycetales bacterium]
MIDSIHDIEALLHHTQPITGNVPTTSLRQWRNELVEASVAVSYAISILGLDLSLLDRALASSHADVLQYLIDELPKLLGAQWVGGGWSLSPDASASVAAASLLTSQDSELYALHAAVASCDFNDADVVGDLRERADQQHKGLHRLHDQLESRVRDIQSAMRHRYATGAASVDDWLT